MTVLELFALLVFGHMLADHPLQGPFLAIEKSRRNQKPTFPWQQALAAHCIIQGGMVGIITGSLWLGCAEAVVHWFIDDARCQGRISVHVDQALHIACKVAWVAVLYWLGVVA